jgi:CRP-like cAMP-binding protein
LFAWQIKLGNLNTELEHVLATRDARDWQAFEAASWVSAAFRLQESQRRALWMEPLPTVEVADRLRRLPLFASLSVDGLFRITGTGNQERHESGRTLYQAGATPETIHILLDGRVSCRSSAGTVREIAAPATLAFQEVLETRPIGEIARTTDPAICLDLSGEEFRGLLADDTELVQGLFQTLCGTDRDQASNLVFKGKSEEGKASIPQAGLKPIDKILILKNIPVFSDVSAEEMPGLASIAAEVPLVAGTALFEEASQPALFALITGEISLESSAGEPALIAGANDAVGVQQALAGINLGRNGRAVSNGSALRIEREDLFDLIAQRPDLLRQLFSALSRARATRTAAASA